MKTKSSLLPTVVAVATLVESVIRVAQVEVVAGQVPMVLPQLPRLAVLAATLPSKVPTQVTL